MVEFVDQSDEFARPAAQAVEIQDDQDVVLAQVIETGGQIRSVGGAGSAVLEYALAAGVVQGVELTVEDLAAFGGGYAGVADESHGMSSSRSRK